MLNDTLKMSLVALVQNPNYNIKTAENAKKFYNYICNFIIGIEKNDKLEKLITRKKIGSYNIIIKIR